MAEQRQSKKDESVAQFLLLCLCGRWDPTALDHARALGARSDLDWNALCRVAYVEGVAPLLYHIARAQDLLPPSVKQNLRLIYYHNAGRNLFLFHKLKGVVGHLMAEGVPVILLKGAALAKTVYRNASVRPMVDLDLLVRREDVSTALHVLTSLDYETIPSHTYWDAVVLHKQGQVDTVFDVHWGLFLSFYYQHAIPMDWFWQTARSVGMGDASAWVLGPEAQVLHLCGHLLLHHSDGEGFRLLGLHDVAEVIVFYQEQIEWDQVLARAQAYDLVLPVQQILTQVGKEWNTPIPSAVLERLRALRPSRDEERVFAWFSTVHSSPAQSFRANLASIPGWGLRLRFVWCNLFPPVGYMQHCYRIPHWLLVPLYYPYRWFLALCHVLRRRDSPYMGPFPGRAAWGGRTTCQNQGWQI